ncbi:WXG100 family type VII secretion target [Natronoglycomyces albus]|uniref:ESAT-6-like protein n=1 Tax=Natronoglycomyces albus TaxID=2811108 RepID=A0A895XIR7_9ACTN|nr:WXG100 family type VII secretion target [Natronoglycomyces albus]QSB04857.1 WXG100 family type VII secretion target [Natronoglycomyces albus]
MARVDAELAELHNAGNQTQSTAGEVRSSTQSVLSGIEPLSTGLVGDAGDAFKLWVSTVQSEMTTVEQKLEKIGDAINQSAEKYQSSDSESGSSIRGVGSGMDGIASQLR